MPKHPTSILVLSMSLAILSAAPAIAADGQIVITQAKANAGNVTPGDAPGFPATLSRPGSYILASNLRPPANKAGIDITSDRVTVDLNGFQLNGAPGATTGIRADAITGTTIRNGTVTGFAGDGIYGQGRNWIVDDMRVVENGGDGINVGAYASVRGSTVAENGGTGILCEQRCLVEDSISSGNGVTGIAIVTGTVLGNVIIGNTGYGIHGSQFVGYGNSILTFNHGGGAHPQAYLGVGLHPNLCDPACP